MSLQLTQQPHDPLAHTGYRFAAIIDEQGREIPITQAMISGACHQLSNKLSSHYQQLRQQMTAQV